MGDEAAGDEAAVDEAAVDEAAVDEAAPDNDAKRATPAAEAAMLRAGPPLLRKATPRLQQRVEEWGNPAVAH